MRRELPPSGESESGRVWLWRPSLRPLPRGGLGGWVGRARCSSRRAPGERRGRLATPRRPAPRGEPRLEGSERVDGNRPRARHPLERGRVSRGQAEGRHGVRLAERPRGKIVGAAWIRRTSSVTKSWLRQGAMGLMTPASDSVEAYRTAYLRLRLLLLGDGIDMPGLVRGEESRLRVTAELRHMRDVFHAGVVEDKEGRAEKAEARVVNLEEELRKIASFRAHAQQMRTDAIPVLLTPAESAKALRLSVSSIYRAVRDGEYTRGEADEQEGRGATDSCERDPEAPRGSPAGRGLNSVA